MAGTPQAPPVLLEDGWEKIIKPQAIDRLKEILDSGSMNDRKLTALFSAKEYSPIYT